MLTSSQILLFLVLGCFAASVASRPASLWFPWFFPPEEEEAPKDHPHPELVVKELPVPEAPSTVNWFAEENKEFHRAILIAGSKGYRNYRHQADVCHAYRILRERGLKDENIITMVYDDIAYNSENPYQGQIFNSPGGKDVYPGCAKDYTGYDVNKDTVMAVLTGDAEAVQGKGSGRVLERDPEQRVFMFYSDHGSIGTIGMPKGQPFSGRDLNKAFDYMVENEFFKELVFYLESCESGSMFQGFGYEEQKKILPVSASEADESSYATYCPFGSFDHKSVIPNASYIGACLGDLFSVSWMEYAESHDVAAHSIRDQLAYTDERTSDSHTYYLGSHMVNYGHANNSMERQVVGNFLSFFDVPPGLSKKDAFEEVPSLQELKSELMANQDGYRTMKQRDADLMYLVERSMNNDFEHQDAAMKELQDTLKERRTADLNIRSVVQHLVDGGLLDGRRNGIEDYVARLLPRASHLQVVDDWDCFETFIKVWAELCGDMDDYSMQYTRAFANLCNSGVDIPDFVQATTHTCTMNKKAYAAA